MPTYDFRSLSPRDFEQLVRDLIQADMGIALESFTAGRDGGIDLRNRQMNVIVQCKHFADSTFAQLLHALKNVEKPKVESLAPERYVLVTSQGLTPARKGQIREIFDPFCRSDADVFGRDDLNGMLARNPKIEEQNFKLWLTSEVVLRRIVRAGAVDETLRAVERMRIRTRRYVNTPTFRRALDILDESHFCIIAGIPGIGKTTLAEVLLIHYVDRHGFEPVRIKYDLSEIAEAALWNERQVFYFDDFLGRTTLDSLRRNEDQRLVEFIREVSDNPRWRLILTTREYILNRARRRYESLSNANLDLETCVVGLRDYTTEMRAAILYNHIYFADIDRSYKRALLADRTYRRIALHANYSPRIVEHMTTARNVATITSEEYAAAFIESLDNPAYVWRHAFEEQLSKEAQTLLLVLGSFADEILLQDAEAAYLSFAQVRQQRYGGERSPGEFEHALRELEGNFTITKRVGADILVEFHNPSVSDFVTHYLSERTNDVRDLYDAAVFFEQCEHLVYGPNETRSPAAKLVSAAVAQACERLLRAPTARLTRVYETFFVTGVKHVDVTLFERCAELIGIADMLDAPEVEAIAETTIGELAEAARRHEGERLAYTSAIRAVTKRRQRTGREEEFLLAAKEYIFSGGDNLDDFQSMAAFCEEYRAVVTENDRAVAGARLVSFCEDEVAYAEDTATDADELYSIADSLSFVAEKLGVVESTMDLIERIRDSADELSSQEPEDDEPERDWDDDEPARFNIDEMFEGLLHDLDSVEGSSE